MINRCSVITALKVMGGDTFKVGANHNGYRIAKIEEVGDGDHAIHIEAYDGKHYSTTLLYKHAIEMVEWMENVP